MNWQGSVVAVKTQYHQLSVIRGRMVVKADL
jgi:hypothetical protein